LAVVVHARKCAVVDAVAPTVTETANGLAAVRRVAVLLGLHVLQILQHARIARRATLYKCQRRIQGIDAIYVTMIRRGIGCTVTHVIMMFVKPVLKKVPLSLLHAQQHQRQHPLLLTSSHYLLTKRLLSHLPFNCRLKVRNEESS